MTFLLSFLYLLCQYLTIIVLIRVVLSWFFPQGQGLERPDWGELAIGRQCGQALEPEPWPGTLVRLKTGQNRVQAGRVLQVFGQPDRVADDRIGYLQVIRDPAFFIGQIGLNFDLSQFQYPTILV